MLYSGELNGGAVLRGRSRFSDTPVTHSFYLYGSNYGKPCVICGWNLGGLKENSCDHTVFVRGSNLITGLLHKGVSITGVAFSLFDVV